MSRQSNGNNSGVFIRVKVRSRLPLNVFQSTCRLWAISSYWSADFVLVTSHCYLIIFYHLHLITQPRKYVIISLARITNTWYIFLWKLHRRFHENNIRAENDVGLAFTLITWDNFTVLLANAKYLIDAGKFRNADENVVKHKHPMLQLELKRKQRECYNSCALSVFSAWTEMCAKAFILYIKMVL